MLFETGPKNRKQSSCNLDLTEIQSWQHWWDNDWTQTRGDKVFFKGFFFCRQQDTGERGLNKSGHDKTTDHGRETRGTHKEKEERTTSDDQSWKLEKLSMCQWFHFHSASYHNVILYTAYTCFPFIYHFVYDRPVKCQWAALVYVTACLQCELLIQHNHATACWFKSILALIASSCIAVVCHICCILYMLSMCMRCSAALANKQ